MPDTARFFTGYAIRGLLFQTYWLVEQGDSLFLIDQHAAHERVLYEDILNEMKNGSGAVPSQPLLEPAQLSLTPQETQTFKDNADIFERFGFDTRETDDGSIAVTSVPFFFKGPLPVVFFIEILDKMEETPSAGLHPAEYKTAVIAMAACKAAVKANDRLSEAEARALLVRLLEMENPYSCPHGRPTIIEITRRELERKFKRVV
jgi:DNA mismatch repair protein MutL